MKYIFAFFVLFCSFISSTLLAHDPLCFQIHWKASPDASARAKQEEKGVNFVSLNGQAVTFYSDESSVVFGPHYVDGEIKGSKPIASISKGCSNGSVLVVGTNSIQLNYIIVGVSQLKSGWFESTLFLTNKNSLEMLCNTYIQAGGIARGDCSATIERTLEELAPELLRRIQELEDELFQLKRFAKLDELANKFSKSKDLLAQLKSKSFEDLSADDFKIFASVYVMITSLKRDVEVIKKDIQDTHNRIQQRLVESGKVVHEELKKEGFSDLGPWVMDEDCPMYVNEEGKNSTQGEVDEINEQDNIYRSYADKVISILDSHLKSNDRLGFLAEVGSWAKNIKTYEEIALNRQFFSKKEWEIYQQQYARVDKFIHSHIDKDLWFKDTPVPQEVRTLLKDDIKDLAPEEGATLESFLKKLSRQSLTDEQKRGIELVRALGLIAKEVKQSVNDGLELVQEFRSQVKYTTQVISKEVKCLSQSLVLGPAGSLYELFFGKDQCEERELSDGERIFSGLEVIFVAPKLIKSIGKIAGLGSVVAKGLALADVAKTHKIEFQAANKLRFKNNPLKNTVYSLKVERQRMLRDFHDFPDEVDNFSGWGKVGSLVGGDGAMRTKIVLPGSYNGKLGHFEWIIEADGKTVHHRLFVESK